MAHLRLVKSTPTTAFSYQNRMGVTYYLHGGTTKTGKPRYFVAKTIGEGALAEVPEGFEVTESINGVVAVRRKRLDDVTIPAEDVKLVESVIARHQHLRGYIARAVGNAVLVFEPDAHPAKLRALAGRYGFSERAEAYVQERIQSARYQPVMKFEREGGEYVAMRMCRIAASWGH